MLAGTPFAHELDFSTGLPTGAVVYSVLGNDGTPIVGYDSVSVVPPVDALSILIVVPGSVNTVNTPLFEARTLTWTYPTANGVVNGRTRYRVEKDIPFPVSEDGVRTKLGVEDHELEDKDINLLLAYAALNEQFPLSAYENSGNYNTLVVVNAIEAQAALDVLPSLQLAVAKSEDSGTNKYQRFTSIDWEGLAESLNTAIYRLQNLTGVGTSSVVATIFVATGPTTDRVTNADYV